MCERLLDKNNPPAADFIPEYVGEKSHAILLRFEDFLNGHYQLTREMKFPFGNQYGWGYKYSHKASHLCYAFFESGAFTVTLHPGDRHVPRVEQILPGLSKKAQGLWENRYPCGKRGGWVHYRVMDADGLNDVIEFVKAEKKPAKRQESATVCFLKESREHGFRLFGVTCRPRAARAFLPYRHVDFLPRGVDPAAISGIFRDKYGQGRRSADSVPAGRHAKRRPRG